MYSRINTGCVCSVLYVNASRSSDRFNAAADEILMKMQGASEQEKCFLSYALFMCASQVIDVALIVYDLNQEATYYKE